MHDVRAADAASDSGAIAHEVRSLLVRHGRMSADIAALGTDDDLYDAGLSSLASVNLMLALEERFDVEFPEHMLRRKTFSSIASICAAIGTLRGGA
jgi:acyl carrier protein